MLIEPLESVCSSHFPVLSHAFWHDARLIAQTQSDENLVHPIVQQAMMGILRCGVEALEQDPQKSKLARLLNHPRMGKWFHGELQKNGPMASITAAALSCHYSSSGFSKSVLQTIAVPYADFINHWRMSWSLLRFVHQKRNVKAESDFWGYETESSFRKRFRSVIGITPGYARQLTSLERLEEVETSFIATTPLLSSETPDAATIAYTSAFHEATLFDPLTGLAKPRHWMNEARKLLEAAHRYGDKMAIAFIDLDHFNAVNENFGTEVGDLLLKAVAQRLQACLRSHDLMARQGGDQFVVLLGRLRSHEDVATVAQKMTHVLNTPFAIHKHTLTISASIGLEWFDGGPENIETLLRHANVAMYQAKSAGRNDWCFFRADMDQPATEKLLFENGLQQAIKNNELILHYQPQINSQTGELVSAEVLVRWHHRELGLLTPDRWIPWLLKNGQIEELSLWILEQTCRQWQTWIEMGLSAKLAINVFAVELLNKNFLKNLKKILDETKMNPSMLELEVNDLLSIKNNKNLINAINDIYKNGIQVSLDDFSLDYFGANDLRNMNLSKIKIDRTFTCDIPGDQEDESILKTTLSLVHSMGFKVVAEGVERVQQQQFLRAINCDHLQGWLVARPMDGAVFETWWQRRKQ
jgi:diguanylate cyclase (GGDEF)-like protein